MFVQTSIYSQQKSLGCRLIQECYNKRLPEFSPSSHAQDAPTLLITKYKYYPLPINCLLPTFFPSEYIADLTNTKIEMTEKYTLEYFLICPTFLHVCRLNSSTVPYGLGSIYGCSLNGANIH